MGKKIATDSQNKFSRDDDEAEKGPSADADNIDDREDTETKEEFRRDAKSWATYLQEAGEHAKEQAEVWKTGLESLLLFAGLFASVITSFLVESRQKLRLDDQEALLMDIRSALLNEPIGPHDYAPTPAQLLVNGLWFTSLLVTLFSAIVGVLARSWLVNYLPLASRQEAGDAYKRWMLDRRAERWKMQKIITGIPLLVQIAFFLFSLGLGIQAYTDNKALGIAVLSLVAGGTLTYLVVTVLPLILPADSCPFKTPLSDVLLDFWTMFLYVLPKAVKPPMRFTTEDLANTLARILYEGLIKSSKPEQVDEAILELNRRPLQVARRQFFAASDTPSICIRRLRECMSPRIDDPSRRGEIIGAHLQVLSQIVTSWEDGGHENGLGLVLKKALGRAGPLGRWDFFPEPLRALAYTVRVPLYLALGLDFDDSGSLLGDQWATMVRCVEPAYRLKFVSTACRGVAQGQKTLQCVSAFSLVYLLAKSYGSGTDTEWVISRHPDRGAILQICQQYLQKLFETIEATWKDSSTSFFDVPPNLEAPAPAPGSDRYPDWWQKKNYKLGLDGGLPSHLIDALKAEDHTTRMRANTTLVSLAQQEHAGIEVMELMLSTLFDTMFGPDFAPYAVPECIDVARAMSRTKYVGVMTATLTHRLLKGLSGIIYDVEVQEAFSIIAELVKRVIFPEPGVEEVLRLVAPQIIILNLKYDFPPSVERWASLTPLASLHENSKLVRDAVQESLSTELSKVFNRVPLTGHEDEAPKLEDNTLMEECLAPVASLLLIKVTTEDGAVGTLVDDITVQRTLGPCVATIIDLTLHGMTSQQRSAGVTILLTLAEGWRHEYGARGWKHSSPPSTETRDTIYQMFLMTLHFGCMIGGVDVKALIHIARCLMLQVDLHANNYVPAGERPPTEKLEAVIRQFLPPLFKPEWKDAVVPFFSELAADDRYREGVISAFNSPADAKILCEGCTDKSGLVKIMHRLVANGWSEGMALIMEIAIHDPSPVAQDVASRALAALSEAPDLGIAITVAIQAKLQLNDDDLSLSREGGHSVAAVGWRKLLILLSAKESMRGFCSVALTRIGMASQKTIVLNPAKSDLDAARLIYRRQMEDLSNHSHPQVRRAGVELLGNIAAEFSASSFIEHVVALAFTDGDSDIRLLCVGHLADLATDVASIPLVVEAMQRANYKRAESMTDALWRHEWCRLLKALALRGDFENGIAHLVKVALKDHDGDVRISAITSLRDLAETDGDYTDIMMTKTMFSKTVDAVSADPDFSVRVAWCSLIASIAIKESKWKEGPEALIYLALNDGYRAVRLAAYEALAVLIADLKRREALIAQLESSFDTNLRTFAYKPVLEDFRPEYPYAVPFDIVSCFIPSLTRNVIERADDDPYSTPQEVALSHISTHGDLGHQAALLMNLGQNLGQGIPGARGARFAIEVASHVYARPNHPISMIPHVKPLGSLLNHISRHVRSAALGVLDVFYRDSTTLTQTDTEPILQPLAAMVLHDPDTDLRNKAAGLLCNLCNNDFTTAMRLSLMAPDYLLQFMELVRNQAPLSLTVARLVAAMASTDTGDQRIARWIMTEVTSERFVDREQGILSLLSELITRRTLDTTITSNYILLLIASALANRGSTTSNAYRPLLAESMWLYYRDQIPASDSRTMMELTNLFQFATFGHHGTNTEAEIWLSMSRYIKV